MNPRVSLVIQGALAPFTLPMAESWAALDWVQEIVVSCWDTCPGAAPAHPRIRILRGPDIANPGTGNRNRQIVSSHRGLASVETRTHCAKFRSDQIIAAGELDRMYQWWCRHRNPAPMSSVYRDRIFTLGLYRTFPYHPRDHVFWGWWSDLNALFGIPLDPEAPNADYDARTRAETYIGQFYFARVDGRAARHAAAPLEYLVDAAPRRDEAMAVDAAWRELLFASFPRIQMKWPKHHLESYHYDVGATFGEYWSEEPLSGAPG